MQFLARESRDKRGEREIDERETIVSVYRIIPVDPQLHSKNARRSTFIALRAPFGFPSVAIDRSAGHRACCIKI